MRVDLADDPAVIGMAASLKTEEDDIVGKLHRLWSWADKHTSNGFVPHITEKWIDKYIAKNGFAKQMCAVGWLVIDVTGVTFPHFDRHNGESAKSRAENTERARLSRKLRDKKPTNSEETSHKNRDKSVTREEKRREEYVNPIPSHVEAVTTVEVYGSSGAEKIDRATGEVTSWAA